MCIFMVVVSFDKISFIYYFNCTFCDFVKCTFSDTENIRKYVISHNVVCTK